MTATRRSTRLQKTAQAITVLNGKVQRARGEQGLADLQTTVPNVTFSSTSNSSQIYIRGIGSTFLNSGGDAGVGFYQDSAYVSDQTTTNTSMFDIDRVEVVRGPQGALYGRNAVGGAIIITSAKPTDNLHIGIDALVGDYGRRESEGYISGPLEYANTDVRVSYALKRFDGYTGNELAGKNGAPARFDDLDSDAFRIQTLTHLPTDGRRAFSSVTIVNTRMDQRLASSHSKASSTRKRRSSAQCRRRIRARSKPTQATTTSRSRRSTSTSFSH